MAEELKLKDIDKKLLNIIQEADMAVPRVTKIAHKLGIPVSTVKTKLDKFQKIGVVKGYSAELDPEKVDKSLVAFRFVRKKFKNEEDMVNFGNYLSKLPNVQEVYLVVGEWTFIVKLRFKDHHEYTDTVPEVVIWSDACQGMICPKTFKDSKKVLIK